MKKFLLLILPLIISCNTSNLINEYLPEEEILKHVNFVLNKLQEQGFDGIIGEAKKSKIYVPTEINGQQEDFFIDTGATYTFLNYNHIEKYNLKKLTTGKKSTNITTLFGNITKYERALADEFKIGSNRFTPWPFIINNGDKDPVLGTDFLHYTNAVIICKYSTMLFNVNQKKAVGLSDSLIKFGYTEIDLRLSRVSDLNKISYKKSDKTFNLEIGTFTVCANFNGIKGNILIDTGASYTSIDHDLAKFTGRKVKQQNSIYFIDAVGNISYPSLIFADSLKIDKYFLGIKRFFPIFEGLNKNVSSQDLPFLGVLGIDYLTKNNAIIDFGNRKVYLIK